MSGLLGFGIEGSVLLLVAVAAVLYLATRARRPTVSVFAEDRPFEADDDGWMLDSDAPPPSRVLRITAQSQERDELAVSLVLAARCGLRAAVAYAGPGTRYIELTLQPEETRLHLGKLRRGRAVTVDLALSDTPPQLTYRVDSPHAVDWFGKPDAQEERVAVVPLPDAEGTRSESTLRKPELPTLGASLVGALSTYGAFVPWRTLPSRWVPMATELAIPAALAALVVTAYFLLRPVRTRVVQGYLEPHRLHVPGAPAEPKPVRQAGRQQVPFP